ncbi:MAG: hypothetical protein ACW96N_02290 [Candidatus Thorarchaeota archaeon]|jgi:hypothetical protein
MVKKVNQKGIWRQKEVDIPIVIVRFLGLDDKGEEWYLVEGTSSNFQGMTGVPESEILLERDLFNKPS